MVVASSSSIVLASTLFIDSSRYKKVNKTFMARWQDNKNKLNRFPEDQLQAHYIWCNREFARIGQIQLLNIVYSNNWFFLRLKKKNRIIICVGHNVSTRIR